MALINLLHSPKVKNIAQHKDTDSYVSFMAGGTLCVLRLVNLDKLSEHQKIGSKRGTSRLVEYYNSIEQD